MKKIMTILLALTITICFSGSAFARVIPEYKQIIMDNNNDKMVLTLDITNENGPVYFYSNGYLYVEMGDIFYDSENRKLEKVTITATDETTIGKHVVFFSNNKDTDDGFAFVNIYVTDKSKIDISNAKKNKNKTKISWTKGKSGLYQLQYREKDGTWKNATKEYVTKNYYNFSNLKKGKTYSFRVRTVTPLSYEWYGEEIGDEYQFGKWSESFSYKIK